MGKALEVRVTYTEQGIKLYEDCYLKDSNRIVDLQEGTDVWFTFSEQGLKQWHAEKGRKGGQKSKRGAKADSERSTKPWEAMGISRATYYRRQKKQEKK